MRPVFFIIGLCVALIGCASIDNAPVNQPGNNAGLAGSVHRNFEERSSEDDDLVGLSFSGGGTRASAFSFGVLTEMEHTPVRGGGASMLDRIDFISGVSGGAVTAAYYGLRKRAALDDFREKFLLRNAEEGLQTDLNLGTIGRAFAGGINDSRGFPRWLDANLFNGATFGELRETGRPRVWINASDIYNRTPFVFGATAFNAMCSDLSKYPLANAVAASAAVPVAFAPVVIQTFPRRSAAITTEKFPTSSCSTVGWSIIMVCPASPSRGFQQTRPMGRYRPSRPSSCGAGCSWWSTPRPASPATGSIRWKARPASNWCGRRRTRRLTPASTPASPHS